MWNINRPFAASLHSFNLEISQSGSYVPHGIKLGHLKNDLGQTYNDMETLYNCHELHQHPYPARPSSCFSCSTAILFCVKNELK